MLINIRSFLWKVKFIYLVVFIPVILSARSEYSKPNGREMKLKDIKDLVTSWGYPLEPHKVTTDDGYILTIFRIPNKKMTNKSPVFLQHGNISSGGVILAHKQGYAFHFYNHGYDVWVGNSRGSKFSKGHVSLNPNENEFWDFSFHEMGLFDTPANLRTITSITGKPKVHYLGHSLGCTTFLVMASLRPEMLELVDTVVLMGPIARSKHLYETQGKVLKNTAMFIAKNLPKIGVARHHQQLWLGKLLFLVCTNDSFFGKLCSKLKGGKQDNKVIEHSTQDQQVNSKQSEEHGESEKRTGFKTIDRIDSKPSDTDLENVGYAVQYFYDSTSYKTHLHLIQNGKAGRFQEFDTGKKKPRKYPLWKINKRIYILQGGMDDFATLEDSLWLQKHLKGSWMIEKGFEEFDHFSFSFGMGLPIALDYVTEILEASEYGRDPNLVKTEIPEEDEPESSQELQGNHCGLSCWIKKFLLIKKLSTRNNRDENVSK